MFSRYDFMTGRELKDLFSRLYGKNQGKKLPLNRNQAGYKYRLFFIQEDLKNGVNPYLSSEGQQLPPSPSEDLECL
jgi:hypothetical protein